MGPVHGAIVNWAGHKIGYQNFDNGDRSRNTLVLDVLTMGELFQNNHHKYGMSPNFAARWFELDPTWQVMRLLAKVGLIRIATTQRASTPSRSPRRPEPSAREPEPAPADHASGKVGHAGETGPGGGSRPSPTASRSGR
jgi:stearoyl-CoA desaturase (delta-9 desaturase)